jgi:hypothetical protein
MRLFCRKILLISGEIGHFSSLKSQPVESIIQYEDFMTSSISMFKTNTQITNTFGIYLLRKISKYQDLLVFRNFDKIKKVIVT